MNSGYWINYSTGKKFRIEEHERWIRQWRNAKKLGISSDLFDEFDEFTPVEDRDEMLMYVMEKAPVMRMRGHGGLYSFEFNTRRAKKPLESIWEFCMDYAGDYTSLYIVNFATKEKVQMLYKDFNNLMMEGLEDAVLRVAKKIRLRRGSQDMANILRGDNVEPLSE